MKKWFLLGLMVVIINILQVFLNYRAVNKTKSWEIEGLITDVEYAANDMAQVRVRSIKYSLGCYHIHSSDSMIVGDSLYKSKVNHVLYHYKLDDSLKYYLYNKYELSCRIW